MKDFVDKELFPGLQNLDVSDLNKVWTSLFFWWVTFLLALEITWKTLRLSFRLWTSWMRLILMPAKTVIPLAIFTKAFALFAECGQLWRVLYSSLNYRNHQGNYNLLIGGKVFVPAVVRGIFGKCNWKYQGTEYSFCWRLKNSWKLESCKYRECSDYARNYLAERITYLSIY